MRASWVIMGAMLTATVAACMGHDTGTQTTTTSASQGAVMTGTGATGGSTPETDMQGTGRTSAPVVIPREAVPPPKIVPLPQSAPPPASNDAGPRIEPMMDMDGGAPLEPPADR